MWLSKGKVVFISLLTVIFLVAVGACGSEDNGPNETPVPKADSLNTSPPPTPTVGLESGPQDTFTVLVDDFFQQPIQGDQFWRFNRLGGDREEVGAGDAAFVVWGEGTVSVRILGGQLTSVGFRESLIHSLQEKIPLNASAVFPSQIKSEFQGRVTGLVLRVLDGRGELKIELQSPGSQPAWTQTVSLNGGPQALKFDLHQLQEIASLDTILIGTEGDFVIVDRIELLVEMPHLPIEHRAFLISYANLLANLDMSTGLTRDRSNWPRGDFDNVSAGALLAAATASASELGYISREAAIKIVDTITEGVEKLIKCHGLLPHFASRGSITPGTEFSSLDTVVTLISLISARQALGLDMGSQENLLTAIDWDSLITANGFLSHGYNFDCVRLLPNDWDVFGSEAWLVNFAFAAATGNIVNFDEDHVTYNGSGFISEIAFLQIRPPEIDVWGIDWHSVREQAVGQQLGYYANNPCFGGALFGLSAAEVPDPAAVAPGQIYQAFGVGGKVPPNDGSDLLGSPVVIPHYAGLASSLRPEAAKQLWTWLETEGLASPLNNVESLTFTEPRSCEGIVWNSLKGSWNLGLQSLGWARLIFDDDSNPLYLAVLKNELLSKGNEILATNPSFATPTPNPSSSPTNTATPTTLPAGTMTPTPTNTPTPIPTSTTTPPTSTPIPTNTPTPLPTSTTTPPTSTPIPTNTLAPTPTDTPTPTPPPPPPLSEIKIEGESIGTGHGQIMDRGLAQQQKTVSLQTGQSRDYEFSTPAAATYSMTIIYSNDNDDNKPGETIDIELDGVGIYSFIASDTGSGGNGWNVFFTTSTTDIVINAGTHTLKLIVSGGDDYGIEIDQIRMTLQQ